jgi:hypothetical protein
MKMSNNDDEEAIGGIDQENHSDSFQAPDIPRERVDVDPYKQDQIRKP